MIEELKLLLGDSASNYSDALLGLVLKNSLIEVEEYCGRDVDSALELCALKIAVIKLNRMGSEGLASQSFSGVSESFDNEYPADILAILNRKRKIKVVRG